MAGRERAWREPAGERRAGTKGRLSMSNANRRLLVLVAASGAVLAAPPGALAEERDCVGAIGAETVDNVRVPEGAACTMNGTFVKGTVKVERGATLEAQA